jgi:hypothetical protein
MSDNKFFKKKPTQPVKQRQKREVASKHPIFSLLYSMENDGTTFSFKDTSATALVDEINYRIKFVETVKADPVWVKANKFKISQIESEAMDSGDIPMLGAFFRAVCARNNWYVMVIKGNIYKTSGCDDDCEPTHVIEYNSSSDRFILLDDVSRSKHARDNFFEFSKPLRAISGYKVDELREIARRVGVDESDLNGLLKKQIYEKILSCLSF